MKNKNNYNLKNYFYFLLNMSSFTNSRVGKRGKGVFKRNKNSNQLISDDSAYYGNQSKKFSKIMQLIYYFEFDYEKTIKKSKDFKDQHDSKLTDLNISNKYVSANGTDFITTVFTGENQHTKVQLDIPLAIKLKQNFYRISQVYLEELKKQILQNAFQFQFKDQNNNTVTANAIKFLRADNIHKYVYRFNTLYNFNNKATDDDNIVFQIESAHHSKTSNIVKNGDKVWLKKRIGNGFSYLSGDFYDNKIAFKTGNITWKKGRKDRLLFEIHAFDNKKMQIENIINSKFNIQTDYGFKLEILPSTIKGLFDGLSSFVDNYKFEDDGDYNFNDYVDVKNNDDDVLNKLLVDGLDVLNYQKNYKNNNTNELGNPTYFNPYDHYKNENWKNYTNSNFLTNDGIGYEYEIETGNTTNFTKPVVDNPNIPNKTFDIDEVFLTFKKDKFSFTFNNDHEDSKKFFNANIVDDLYDEDDTDDYTSEESDVEDNEYETQNGTVFGL